PFSGVYKDLGLDAKNGFLLGLKKEAGEAKVHVESWVTFDFVDDLADADHSLELAKQVIEEGAKAILGIVSSAVAWSCTSSLRIISPLSKPGKMPPDHTTMRGHYHDSVSCLLPTGDSGTPLVMHHAALCLAQPRRGVISATGRTHASSAQAQTHHRGH